MSFLKGLAHVGIPVSNMEVSKAFYLDLLGCTLDFETFIPRDGGQSTHVTLLRLGDLCLELVGGYGAPVGPSAQTRPVETFGRSFYPPDRAHEKRGLDFGEGGIS